MIIEFDTGVGAVAPHGRETLDIVNALAVLERCGGARRTAVGRPVAYRRGLGIDRSPRSAQCLLVSAYLGGPSMSLVDLLPSDARLTTVPAGDQRLVKRLH